MQLRTAHMGAIDVKEESLLEFPGGLFGYESVTHYALVTPEPSPFQWLQAIERDDLGFAVLAARIFAPDYQVELTDPQRERLGLHDGEAPSVYAIVGIPEDPNDLSANLKGPLVINQRTRIGLQIILPGDHPSRFPILAALRDRRKGQDQCS